MRGLSDPLAVADTQPVEESNPFVGQVAQEGDSIIELVDIASLHEPARRALERGSSRSRAGRPYLAALIGEEGAGKSHLLWWLRKQQRGAPGLFVSMGALPDLAQPFRHALKQLVSALCRKEQGSDKSGKTFERPIDQLLWEALFAQVCDLFDAARVGMYQVPATLIKLIGPLCMEAGRRRGLADFVAAAQPIWQQVEPGLRAYLLSLPTEMSIDTAARAVVVQYPYADRRALCTAWLAGEELGPKERERIGAKQVINNESAAKYVVCALCRMLTASAESSQGPGALLAVIYDHMDEVAQQLGQPGVQAMAEVISAIQAQGGAALQVVSCRPATWKMLLDKPTRPGPGQLKMVDDTLQLGRATAQELRDLVLGRAGKTSLLSANDLDPAKWPKSVITPRAALAYVAGLWAERADGGPDSVPRLATDAPTAKGLPSGPVKAAVTAPVSARNVPSRPAGAAVTAKMVSGAHSASHPSSKTANSRPPGAVESSAKVAGSRPSGVVESSAKTGGSLPPGAIQVSAKAAQMNSRPPGAAPVSSKAELINSRPLAAGQPSAKKADSRPGNPLAPQTPSSLPVFDATPTPSSSSPSASWIALASGDDLPALAPTPAVAGAPAQSKAAKKAKEPAKPAAKPVLTPLPEPAPSAQSPSATWMEMASDEDPLAKALAAVDAKERAGKR